MCWIISELYEFCKSNQYCDVVLTSEDGKRLVKMTDAIAQQNYVHIITFGFLNFRFCVHRLVLLAASSYFRALFRTTLKEKDQFEFKIPGLNSDILEQVLAFCYQQTIDINENTADALLAAASFLQITELLKHCTKYYELILRPSNSLGIWKIAEQYEVGVLKKLAKEFTLRHFNEMVDSDQELVHVSADHLDEILKNEDLNISHEEDVLRAIFRWILFDCPNRIRFLNMLLKNVCMQHIQNSVSFLESATCIRIWNYLYLHLSFSPVWN